MDAFLIVSISRPELSLCQLVAVTWEISCYRTKGTWNINWMELTLCFAGKPLLEIWRTARLVIQRRTPNSLVWPRPRAGQHQLVQRTSRPESLSAISKLQPPGSPWPDAQFQHFEVPSCIIVLFLRHFGQGPHLRSGTSEEQWLCCGSVQRLRASALLCFWPGRYSISKSKAERISIQRAIWVFGSFKLKSQRSAWWSVLMRNFLPRRYGR